MMRILCLKCQIPLRCALLVYSCVFSTIVYGDFHKYEVVQKNNSKYVK